MRVIALLALSLPLLSACVSVHVDPVPAEVMGEMHRVCIERNPRVLLLDLVPALQDGFRRHGIETAVYDAPVPTDCQFVLTYTARQAWDIVSYLKSVQLVLLAGGRMVGTADYRHGGGASSKWASTSAKISPLVDELLSQTPATR